MRQELEVHLREYHPDAGVMVRTHPTWEGGRRTLFHLKGGKVVTGSEVEVEALDRVVGIRGTGEARVPVGDMVAPGSKMERVAINLVRLEVMMAVGAW
jgi:hypothetical protein